MRAAGPQGKPLYEGRMCSSLVGGYFPTLAILWRGLPRNLDRSGITPGVGLRAWIQVGAALLPWGVSKSPQFPGHSLHGMAGVKKDQQLKRPDDELLWPAQRYLVQRWRGPKKQTKQS